ncbi:MAG: type VI secretion system baseplate subunit TssF [Phycisphaeraceae bacterium]|nr:type VI secretion system baseplate subunit TssF [Phycisphaeraceae bacterium]
MDRRLLRYYERELRHLRETAGEFAQEFPKIAGRLGLTALECSDPYVERLLEGFAYLAARVQLKLDAEFPRISQHLLTSVYPHVLTPIPSMCVVQFQPDPGDAGLAPGPTVARATEIRSIIGGRERTACQYRTAHDVRLYPVRIASATYHTRDVSSLGLPPELSGNATPRAALALRLTTTASIPMKELKLDDLCLYLQGTDQTPLRLYEQIFAHATAIVVRPPARPAPWQNMLPAECLSQRGFDDEDALLPVGARSFQGYRLLQEYFAFPRRFLFAQIGGLQPSVAKAPGRELDIVVAFDAEDPELEGAVSESNFALHCTPAINLFQRRADRVHLTEGQWEYHVVADRTRPLDYEIFDVIAVEGLGAAPEDRTDFKPFYAATEADAGDVGAYFSVARSPRALTDRERRQGRHSKYVGSEVFLSLVDASNAPFQSSLRELGVEILATNRHLPLRMPLGVGRTDFTSDAGVPLQAIRVIAGPTEPRASVAHGDTAWRLVSHLTLNYLSLVETDGHSGAAALRDVLRLHIDTNDPISRKQVEGVRGVACEPIIRRIATPGPISFARGLKIDVKMDEAMFEGTGIFVLGAVLERFFAKYVSINSFTETVIRSEDRGLVKHWNARSGQRALL